MTRRRLDNFYKTRALFSEFNIRRLPYFYWLSVAVGIIFLFSQSCSTVTHPAKPTPPAPSTGDVTTPLPSKQTTPYRVGKNWYYPLLHARDFRERGIASWYGRDFHGRRTSNGEIYDMYAMTAAHKTLPLGTYVIVRNLENNREVNVRINDRGPFVRGRIIDLSYSAASKLDIANAGTAPVEVVALGMAPDREAENRTPGLYVPVDYSKGNFTVQVGAFRDQENALKLKQKLSQTYKNAHITTYDNGNEIFYRVRVGRCSTVEEAEEYEKFLIHQGFEEAMIVGE